MPMWFSTICYICRLFHAPLAASGQPAKTYKLDAGLSDKQVTNMPWWRCLGVPPTPEPDGEPEAVLGGRDLRVATDSRQPLQGKEAPGCRHCV